MKKLFLCILILFFKVSTSFCQSYTPQTAADILSKMERLQVVGSALYFAAHPDDENTRLISYLASERKVRTAYLSLTRGDGGQNLIGTEQGIELGLIRTQELLQARKVDGGEQFFSSAFDFGFSKTYDETFRFWNKEEVLREAVWIIRSLQPDIIITRFPPDERGGHGHHQTSAIIAHEAFKAAADPNAYPEQLTLVKPWKVKRLLWNTANFMRMQGNSQNQLRLDIGNYNPLLGRSYGEIAALSRSQHKSQGFGSAGTNGVLLETFEHVDGDKAESDLFDHIDISWNRISNSSHIAQSIDQLIADFNPQKPYLSIPRLTSLWKDVQKIDDDYWKSRKSKEIEELILACAGIKVESLTAQGSYVKNAPIPYQTEIILRNPDTKVNVLRINGQEINKPLPHNETFFFEGKASIDDITQPYWLVQKPGKGKFNVRSEDFGYPINKDLPATEILLEIGGVNIRINEPLQFKYVDPVRGEVHEFVRVTPALTASFDQQALLIQPQESKMVSITFQNHAQQAKQYTVHVNAGAEGWNIEPTNLTLNFSPDQPYLTKTVNITNNGATNGATNLTLQMQDERLMGLREIAYEHIPKQSWFPDAQIRLQSLTLNNPVNRVAYIMGAGDLVPESLRAIGIDVDILTSESINRNSLQKYDAVVLGVRVMNVDKQIAYKLPELYAYVENGGVVVMQYNVNSGLKKDNFAPKPFKITRARVTEEDAKVTLVDEDDPVLNYPNKITEQDFDGWVQERGLYFAEDVDKSYRTPLSMHDTNEAPHRGSLLINRIGKGKFVYTSLSFFRQLPAGVPGANRLFVNLLTKEK
ncbi:PIG-L family deacetylase [Sphingobacterium wenxiniae]|uniref:GlcNAc-PI de-N-acetylase n=1 Tax=Sphingobacterium wenxiniae TaxID=683125 RepID=A0A1I6SEU4_9SPHI|nr:PIG-L family deacetylase [Sphingobacterium wenxiniae]SFS75485.1 GlcNAc-PI de-N-acetylase [Sphingobacterium wenxiniae]